ncbi:hypothetical protein F5Y14DRAFT_395555 [Nemania sp. NC0429]|nr:hypothetical protein F5Y14DRAFT_395555 [Nemania sp. NC0429]
MIEDTSPSFEEITFKAPLPGHFLGQFLAKNINPITSPSHTGSGFSSSRDKLSVLPIEISLRIVSLLDLCTICHLRLASPSLKNMVDANLDFQIVQLFPNLIKAVYVLQCQYYTLRTLAAAVRDNRCSGCGYYGDFIYLLTAERLCFACFRELPEYVPKAVGPATVFGALRSKVPFGVVPPGAYGFWGRARLETPQLVVDRRALPLLNAHLRQMSRDNGQAGDDILDDSDPEAPRRRHVDRTHPVLSAPWKHAPLPARYTVVLPAPYWEPKTQSFHEGVFCRACAMSAQLMSHPVAWVRSSLFWDYPYRRYAGEEGMRQHLVECGPVKIVLGEDGKTNKYVHETIKRKSFARPAELGLCAARFRGYQEDGFTKLTKPGQRAMEITLKRKTVGKVFGRQH